MANVPQANDPEHNHSPALNPAPAISMFMNSSTMDRIAKLTQLALSRLQNTRSAPAFKTTASCIFVPTGVVPQLPIELIRHTIDLSDRNTLPSLCLVNSVFQEVAIARLYDRLHLCRPVILIKCLRTLSRSPELAGGAHSFMYDRNILDGKGSSVDYMTFFTTALASLLSAAMSNLSNVTYLTLHLLGPVGKSLRGAPFHLVSLDTTADWDEDFIAFLEEQPSIRSFVHHGTHCTGLRVSPSCLPNLSSVDSWPSLVSTLLEGRPVRDVLLTSASRTMMEESTYMDLGRFGKLSTGPISVVSVVSAVAQATPEDFFHILSPIPDNLEEVVMFEFNTYAWGIDEQSCVPFCEFLGRFKKLRYLRVISNSPTDLLHSCDGQRRVLKSLVEQCSTLRNVTLNGEIHALHSNGKWMNVEDIVEILEKQQREAMAKSDAGSGLAGGSTSQSNSSEVAATELAG
ncbi:hypothetical protein GSI_03943 [Ganoderma sinense ZZ0214-1]|uniref:F-box domain-containing protein n=1 Tax=Ganoderma sinense ZZ0214-1 TaxID=1077348 RepID=A0A2G8SKE9_9APHY|nr:hypothetical protein GSI_03943 [Ganoderma sinense ZZ0214-1]